MKSTREQSQEALMVFDPATGSGKPYPSHAHQWRSFNGKTAWLFNPWSGTRRSAEDVGSDIYGMLIVPTKERSHDHPTAYGDEGRV